MTTCNAIRICICHADPLTHAGLSSALGMVPGFEVVQQPTLDASGIDVMVTDFEAGMRLVGSMPGIGERQRVLILTMNDRGRDVNLALRRGIRGYVLQGGALDALEHAVREVFRGRIHLDAILAERLAESLFGHAPTPREEKVLQCLVNGMSNHAIAAHLAVSLGTVKSHLRAIYAKLDVRSRTHAIAVAERRGMLHATSSQDLGCGQTRQIRLAP